MWTIVTRHLVMKRVLSGSRQNADIADTLHLRDVTMATRFCLSIGYNFGCMMASDTLFGSKIPRDSSPVIYAPASHHNLNVSFHYLEKYLPPFKLR